MLMTDYFFNSFRCSLLCLLLLLSACDQTAPPDKLREGSQFPNLTLTGLSQSDRRLDSYRGQLLIVNVWATWCSACRRELPSLQRLQGLLADEGMEVILLSVDKDPVLAREYLRQRDLDLPSFIDSQQDIANRLLGIRIYPDTFIISAQGVLLRRVVGEQVWDAAAVVEALRQLARDGDGSILADLFPAS